ncbi:MAG: (E)-4-hydroxy-3-methylbut-2-enyl-diphosphate synthase [Spirochaetes bacterium]|nr:(E)-4-hydroxy-3-methylbut-2-enyl-diphosphate synthase [Spirochaetota bacterium]
MKYPHTESLTRRIRLKTLEVPIGDTPLGADHPIRVQSMTNTDTMDTRATVEQALRMVEAGCEYVRITAPHVEAARNLGVIKKALRERGCRVPLIADIHFTPNAAEIAARLVEKVRVNPGNYADRKLGKATEFDDATYRSELQRLHEKFSPLVKICKENGTAMRIGSNHGSLSDRILSRYGDTPRGMVESALEFLDICEDHGYRQIVLSMKASNTQIMVQAYRLLVRRMVERGIVYPLHLGVTEAGEGEDGRIKSAVGIGSLLLDGIGDTVRVSLTEDPEVEAPVARAILERIEGIPPASLPEAPTDAWDPFVFTRRKTVPVRRIGEGEPPIVIAPYGGTEIGKDVPSPDYLSFPSAPNSDLGAPSVLPFAAWEGAGKPQGRFPVYPDLRSWKNARERHPALNFVHLQRTAVEDPGLPSLCDGKTALILTPTTKDGARELRLLCLELTAKKMTAPLLVHVPRNENSGPGGEGALSAACLLGPLLLDGFVDGLWLEGGDDGSVRTAFNVLQACRLRMSKTEFISCPSCGRTQFDLQQVSFRIRERLGHIQGLKIAVMGCVVNGPGEMADADFGYVGTGPGKISLYKGHQVMERNLEERGAVERLVDLIRAHGRWVEKKPA